MASALHEEARRFIDLVRTDIVANAPDNTGIASALSRLDEVMAKDSFVETSIEAERITGCKWVDGGLELLEPARPDLVSAVRSIKDHLHWKANAAYPEDRFPDGYFDDWAFTQVIGPGGIFDADDLMMGMFAMGPDIFYPQHYHLAPELYYTLTGTHGWQRGDGPWDTHASPKMIWHEANEVHATDVGSEPFLSVWVWTEDTQNWPVLV